MRKVVVLLPTLNEVGSIDKFCDEVFEQEKKIPGWTIEILIVDSSSLDGTGEKASELSRKNPKIHYINVEKGLGVALIKGHIYSLGNFKPDLLAQLDADGQVDASVLPRLVKGIEEGYSLVVGSRFIKGGKNMLSLSRRIFSFGSSLWCRIFMGPWGIREFTNSARAFTPELFRKINLNRLPWRERTFIIQPAFLHEAVVAGAKYKEVPLIFKDRAEGYSKNKIVNYIYDVITYTLDVRLNSMGINIPLFYLTRRAKTLIKFALVGVSGTAVDFLFYNLFISYFGIRPASSKGFSTEIAIINNFTLNNLWTFRHRKTENSLFKKFGIFNLISIGGLIIGVAVVKILHYKYGDGFVNLAGLQIPYYNLYFFATIPPVMAWNFTFNHFLTWRKKD